MRTFRTLLALTVLVGSMLAAFAPVASAHSSGNTADGKIRVTWGMLDEPATTDAKNRLDLILRWAENSTGIPGAAAAGLHVELTYGDDELPITITPQRNLENEGRYTSTNPIMLTQPGVYTLHVRGTLNGTDVDVSIPGHEIHTLADFGFPPREAPPGGDTSALEARIAALEARIVALEAEAQTQSTTPAPVTQQTGSPTGATPATGGSSTPAFTFLAALGAVAIAVALRRRA